MEGNATRRTLAEAVGVLVADGAVAGVEAHGVETCGGKERGIAGGTQFC